MGAFTFINAGRNGGTCITLAGAPPTSRSGKSLPIRDFMAHS